MSATITAFSKIETGGVKTKILEVTPTMASAWLETNYKKQRPVSKSKVSAYARDMKNGSWKFTGEPLIFDTEGNLINEQHRLYAVIESGETVPFQITQGVNKEAYNYMDIGKKRTPADIVYSAGFKNVTTLGSIGKFVVDYPRRLDSGKTNSDYKASNNEILEWVKANADEEFVSKIMLWKSRFSKILSGARIGGFYAIFSEKDVLQAEEFMNKLVNGTGLDEDSPILLLRNKLITNSASIAKLTVIDIDALVVTAWNYYRLDKKPKVLKWVNRKEGKFPEII